MNILIKGMEMPKDEMKNIMILADGRVFQFSGYGNPKPLGTAVPVQPHGRLIEKNAVFELIQSMPSVDKLLPVEFMKALQEIPTVIPAEEGG